MKKIKPLIMILLFLMAVIMPFMVTDALPHTVEINNPHNGEIFSYSTTNEQFSAYSITTGLAISTQYYYTWMWTIDSIFAGSGGGSKDSSGGGVLIIEREMSVDISSYSVGEHEAYFWIGITGEDASDQHIHTWSRQAPTSIPEITWVAPLNNWLMYNYSATTDYEVEVDVSIEYGFIDNMWMWVNGVLNKTWLWDTSSATRTHDITIDAEIEYNITIKAQSDYNNNYTTYRYIYGILDGSSIIATMYSDVYAKAEPTFEPFTISNTNGLDNCTIFIDFEDVIVVNQVGSFTAVTCNLTYDQLVTIAEYYQAINLTITYDKVQIWDMDYYVDDSGDRFFEFTDASEHVVDSADYYNSVDSFEEDDMSEQFIAGDYAKYKDIVLTNPTATTFTNFVAHIEVTFDSDMEADFGDVAFFDPTGITMLDFDLAEFTVETVAHFWVEIPSFTGSGTYTTRMKYDSAVVDQEDEQGTWDDNNVVLVMHMEDSTDSSGNNYDFTNEGDSVSYSSGIIGDYLTLGGTDDYLKRASDTAALHSLGNTFVIMHYLRTTYNNWMTSFGMASDSLYMRTFCYDTGGSDYMYLTIDGDAEDSQASHWDDNDLVHLAWRLDGTNQDYFVDGVNRAATDTQTGVINGEDDVVTIGIHYNEGSWDYYDDMDEFIIVSEAWADAEIAAFYEFQKDQNDVSTGAENEDLIAQPWDIGEHINWYEGGGATGIRDANYMTMWDPSAGGYCYAYLQDENFQLDEPIQNSAYSYEINISCNNVSAIYSIGFAILADTGYYYKMAVLGNGSCVAGVGTSPYETLGMLSGFTSMDISWTGGWVTLNITILPDIRVIYFVDDVIIRDSYLDDAWQDRTDGNCGLLYLTTRNAPAESKGNLTIDYLNTTDYGDGHKGSEGQTYAEYSDPSVCVYNGSRYIGAITTSDAVGIFSNFGGGAWLDYRDSDSISVKARFRLNTADLTSYNYWQTFKLCATANETDDWWYAIRFTNAQPGRIYFGLDNHSACYGQWLGAGWLEVDSNMDGLWHTYEIQIVKDCWVAAFYDDVLIANTTDPIWLGVWDEDDDENMRVSFATHNLAGGYNSSTMEIDYWSEFNWTYDGWVSSRGWDWEIGSNGLCERESGSMTVWDPHVSSYAYAKASKGDFYAYTSGYQTAGTFFWETALTPNATTAHYDYISMTSRLGSYYFHITLYSNDTLCVGVGDGGPTGTWYSETQASVTFTQNQQYIFRMTVGGSWILYQYSLGSGFITVRNSTSDYDSYFGWANYVVLYVDNAAGQTNAFMEIDYFMSGWDEWQISDAATAGLTHDTTPSLPADIGQNYSVNWTSTQACRFWGTITTGQNLTATAEIIFVGSTATRYDSAWSMNSTTWSYIEEDEEFTMSIRVGEDLGFYDWLNITLMRDSTAPNVTIISPEYRPESDPYSNLQIIPLDYDLQDSNVGGGEANVGWENDMKTLVIDFETFTGDDWLMYPKHKPLQFWEDWHTIVIFAIDGAKNIGNDSVTFYYEERLAKPLELTFTSSIDSQNINAEQYLNIYLDGMPISAVTTTNLNDFDITVYNKFGILLNSTSFDYSPTIAIELPLRLVVFENNNDIVCNYRMSYGLFEKSFWILANTNQTYYLNDTDYILVAEPGDEYFNETHWYVTTYIPFTVESGMSEIEVVLNLMSDDPLRYPLVITLYDKGLDTEMGFVYLTYATSWGNTTCRVKDNATWLGSAKNEGMTIWIFDVTEYGMHNITIFINNSATIVFTDVISFYLEEPEANPNYYLTIHTSIDASGGILYATVNTDWGNCTFRVFDNTVALGGNVSEGSSVWSFDETVYGLHNFTIEVYQGNGLWDTIYTSITIVEPDTETNYFLIIDTSVDASSGLLYVTIETYFGNCTVGVKDNSTWLGSNTTEGSSIWSFTTSYGLHNFSIFVFQGNTVWNMVYTSVTIVQPSTETNYYQVLVISIDSSAGQLFTSIHTYFGNCTIRAFDNSTPLGDNTTEGNVVWSFDSTAYGLHNFSIVVYQGNDIWHTIYTSVTIVEPTPEENILFTLFEKSVDADSGLFYLNYETNWGNTTCCVRDNSTWLGGNATEQISIWSFTTSYGFHNITIEIYNGNDLVYTDVISFVIQEPTTTTNYYEVFSLNIDVDGGLFYTSIFTYWGNCTICVKDNSTWLGGNVTEGNSIWSFTTAYGLHNFSIVVYQGLNIWHTFYTSITIVEPGAETNYYLTIDTSVDASSGLLYVTIETYFGNCTICVKDNSTWLGGNTTEGSSIWSFDSTAYGLHNFSIYVYQSYDLWNMIYTSVTIVEPDVEVLALTLFEKHLDINAGQLYINYETNWGNTTIWVMDNTTWLGPEVSGEEISIWTFVTDYGLHNITIIIRHDSVEWFTDVFSFTIIEPYQVWREVQFSFTSSYDGGVISPEEYLKIYLNNESISAGVGTPLEVFTITVYDKFGQLLYNSTYSYSATISINLPMRLANFTNPNSVICYYRLALGIYEQAFWITQTQTIGYYMLDGNYTLIAEPTTLDAGGGYEYVPTTDSFEVTGGMSDIGVTLLTQQITIIYRPITIRTTSSYTGASVGVRYLKYYLNGTLSLEGATTSTCLLIIRLAVTDVFGNVLYNQSVAYARYIDITVPLRTCTFTNKEIVSTTLTITQSGSEEHLFFVLGGSASIPVFLSDSTYTVILAPISPDKEDGVMWVPKDYDFTCSLSSQSLDLWLDTFDNVPPIFDEFGGNILEWLTNNRWVTLAGMGLGALNFIALIFAIGVIITRLPKAEEKEFDTK